MNLYEYISSNPLIGFDPRGLNEVKVKEDGPFNVALKGTAMAQVRVATTVNMTCSKQTKNEKEGWYITADGTVLLIITLDETKIRNAVRKGSKRNNEDYIARKVREKRALIYGHEQKHINAAKKGLERDENKKALTDLLGSYESKCYDSKDSCEKAVQDELLRTSRSKFFDTASNISEKWGFQHRITNDQEVQKIITKEYNNLTNDQRKTTSYDSVKNKIHEWNDNLPEKSTPYQPNPAPPETSQGWPPTTDDGQERYGNEWRISNGYEADNI